jgi:hypothetical protein
MSHALASIKAARAAAKNADPKVAHAAKRRLLALVSYIIGFFDSRSLIPQSTLEPGFGILFGADARPDLETALDDLESSLESAVSAGATRAINWKHAAGAALEAAGMVIIALAVL